MGSGAETAHETVDWLVARGERVGVLKVRLFRPFDVDALRRPRCRRSVRAIAVLDRTKEPGAVGEPLYQDVVTALAEAPDGAGSPAGRRRPLRPLVQGVHAGDGRRRLRRSSTQPRAAQPLHGRHRRRRDPHLAPLGRGARHRAGRRRARRLLRSRLRRHRRREQELRSRSSARRRTTFAQALLRLRLQEVGRGDGLAPALRRARSAPPYLVRRASFVALPPVRASRAARRARATRAPGATLLLNAPYGSGRALGPAAARGPGGDHREAAPRLRRSTPTGSRARRA